MRASERLRQRLQARLIQHESAGLRRQRLVREGPCEASQVFDGLPRLTFCSNDYLGLASHPSLIDAFRQGAQRYGVGSGASALVTGHCRAHEALQEELADFVGRDAALLFATGYMANLGVINALTAPSAWLFQDALNHASLLDGGWLSRGHSVRFPHADVNALRDLLAHQQREQQRHQARHQRRGQQQEAPLEGMIITDGVFSMDGDLAPLAELVRLADQAGLALMVDDAHGIGCLGTQGRGSLEQVVNDQGRQGILTQDDVPVLIGTFGKAFGTAGAFVAGDRDLIAFLEQFARTHMFSTAMPPALAEATRASLQLVRQEPWRRARLAELIEQFRHGAAQLGLTLLPSATPVQALMIGSVERAVKASQLLSERGIQVSAIRPPTVPQGEARLRITLSAAHSDEHLQRLMEGLADVAVYLHQTARAG